MKMAVNAFGITGMSNFKRDAKGPFGKIISESTIGQG